MIDTYLHVTDQKSKENEPKNGNKYGKYNLFMKGAGFKPLTKRTVKKENKEPVVRFWELTY